MTCSLWLTRISNQGIENEHCDFDYPILNIQLKTDKKKWPWSNCSPDTFNISREGLKAFPNARANAKRISRHVVMDQTLIIATLPFSEKPGHSLSS